ncbi:hypothetical protein [Oryzihumus leptocrescens]|uniref:NurA domain-containing protein n=1 Tax=Oryzihumus leptocrescens TaxID=297536 RepID=A0A542ZKZ0_9MICO|nr:hypothetical protein [Oryzihumus leptocrescens]TQL60958.1 hypothetical protein FB474_2361 [Oryzihumus leptocrescens]
MTTAAPLAIGAITVDPWDPGYGLALTADLDSGIFQESSAQLNLDVEVPADAWAPINPDPAIQPPATVLFLDGVRRIDARIWVHGPDPHPTPGIAASFAAGLVCCNGAARILDVTVGRGLFTAAPHAADILTPLGSYPVRPAAGGGPAELSLSLQQRLADAEVGLALNFRARHTDEDDLLLVDGPLRGRTHLPRTVGYIKTHHAAYLPTPQAATVAALAPGQRTPVFTMGTSWIRHAWYLRLPGPSAAPWSGVVRLECSADLPAPQAARLASVTASLLPPLASVPHKDPRAPQNLVPIGGLERELRHRLGDAQLLYRALRKAGTP